MAKSVHPWVLMLVLAGLITGNLIGAGILGLPVNTGLAGLVPSLVAMVLGGLLMLLTALILGDYAFDNSSETFDFPTLYGRVLGAGGKWVAIAANLIILYGLLTAYFTGGAKIVVSLLGGQVPESVVLAVFSVVLIVITSLDLSFLQRLNVVFMLVLLGTFGVLVAIGVGQIQPRRLNYQDWHYLPCTLPIIVTAFHFHNLIPTLADRLEGDRKTYRWAVCVGMLLAFGMNLTWVMVGIGTLPLTGAHSILDTWHTNTPATVPMGAMLGSKTFIVSAAVFSLTAVTTSFMANGLGLQSFVRDLLVNTCGVRSRMMVVALTFGPPLLIAFVYPDIFLVALNVVGGLGIVTLFCVLPTLITLANPGKPGWLRGVCAVALVAAAGVLIVEVLQETGMLEINPWVEHHLTQMQTADYHH